MSDVARALIDALTPDERARACFAYDDPERTNWHYTPVRRRGLPLAGLDAAKQRLVHAVLASALSLETHAKACAIIALEDVLDRMEGGAMRRSASGYYVSLFGSPDGGRAGWRFEGHHVSVNWTPASITPLFLGANPAALGDVTRPLRAEEERARELLASLDSEQRSSAVLSANPPGDILSGEFPAVDAPLRPGDWRGGPAALAADSMLTDEQRRALVLDATPRGIGSSLLDSRQRDLLDGLVDVYAGRARDGDRPDGEVFFAWAGGARPADPHYYRLQSKGFLAEYDNVQNGANHVHAVWRVPSGDFGAGLGG